MSEEMKQKAHAEWLLFIAKPENRMRMISTDDVARFCAEFAAQVWEQREKERDDCVMLLKAVLGRNGDLQCLREKIAEYLQRKGLTSVLR